MIFISGVHGVGKSFFCSIIQERLGIKTYTASQLIAKRRNLGFDKDKLISNIYENQQYLLDAISEMKAQNEEFILDGHFCLLNAEGKVTRIDSNTFLSLLPSSIVLLKEKPEIICERRKIRDNIISDPLAIAAFQDEEELYAKEISDLISAKIYISSCGEQIESTIDFIRCL